jgi:cytochrome c biogenesis protein CcdA/glutaredoxin
MVFIIVALLFAQYSSEPTLHFFYRPSCGYCMDILYGDIPKLQSEFRFELKKYDIDFMDNYRLLEQMEEAQGATGEDLPVIFIADSVFYGDREVYARVASVLRDFTNKEQGKERKLEDRKDEVPILDKVLMLYYFFQPGCDECSRLEALFTSMEKADSIAVLRHSIFEDTNRIILEAISDEIGIPEEQRLIVPVVIFGNGYLIKQDITAENVFRLIREHRDDDQDTEILNVQGAEQNIMERFSQFSLLGIILAGLLDGVNPCAFATIIFFVSYLLFLGHRRQDIILMAVFFIVAVFLSYFMIGIGAYSILNFLIRYSIIATIIFLCFGIIAIVLGILSLRDYLYAREGNLDKMILQLPLGIKQRIHRDIKEKTAVGGIIVGSFMAGLVVSLLEFGCTGQIYVPTIAFMISRMGLRLKPVVALLIYNIMFVLPLILISLLAIAVSSSKLAKSLGSRIPLIKLLTAILFFALGILLLVSA